ncbi:MAG: hypothetical protein IT235_02075 [Bacteroidia bacterium]|nr:hypothetical protein [Bacteroidia bacterium]
MFKKIFPLVLVGAAAMAAFRFAKKGFVAKSLNVKIAGIKLYPLNSASVSLNVINPTSTAVDFNSIVADIMLNNVAFATISNVQHSVIQANSNQVINLPIKINPVEGVKLALSLFNKPQGYKVSILGSINSSDINFPINIEYTLK